MDVGLRAYDRLAFKGWTFKSPHSETRYGHLPTLAGDSASTSTLQPSHHSGPEPQLERLDGKSTTKTYQTIKVGELGSDDTITPFGGTVRDGEWMGTMRSRALSF
jgi:hypothetical protein